MLPQDKVKRVFLGACHSDALTSTQIVQRFAGKLAVPRELAHGKIHVTIAALVGQTFAFECADKIEHFLHVFGGTGLFGRTQHAQRIAVFVHGGDVAIGQLLDRFTALIGAIDNLVVDIGNVAHILDLIALRHQPAVHHIEHHHDAGMAQVTEVVDRHAAHVHAHLPRVDWL